MIARLSRPLAGMSRGLQLDPGPVALVQLQIGVHHCVLPLSDVEAVLEPSALTGSIDDGRLGEIATATGVIPVVDGAWLFGLERSAAAGRIVVCRGPSPWALGVDRVVGSVRVAADQLQPLPPTCGSPDRLLVRALATLDDGATMLVLSAAALYRAVTSQPERRDGARPFAPAAMLAAAFAAHDDRHVLEVQLHGDPTPRALPLSCVRHVAAYRPPHPLPRAHPSIRGLLTWAGCPIPLVSLVPTDPFVTGPIVVVGPPGPLEVGDDVSAALLVQSIAGVRLADQLDHALLDLSVLLTEIATS